MSHEVQVQKLTDIMAQFVGFTAKKLPDDVPQSGAGNQAGSPIVPGYRRFTVLGKMRNKISID